MNVMTAAAFLLSVHVKNKGGAFFFMHSCMHILENIETKGFCKTLWKMYIKCKKTPKILLNVSNFSKFFSLYFLFDNHGED